MIDELTHQNTFPWERSKYHTTYNKYLAYYKVKSCLENSHGTTALDLACGDGTLTKLLHAQFKEIVGLDASKEHLNNAKKLLPHTWFIESLIEDINETLPNEKFDMIFMLDILEHVGNPSRVLRKVSEHLKEDGTLIIHVPNSDAINRKIAVLMGTLKSCDELSPFDINIAGHRRSYNLESLKYDIYVAGLKTIKTGGIFYKAMSTEQMNWFLENGLWNDNKFGWGRVPESNLVKPEKVDWRDRFCNACYEIGKERPEDCNIIYTCVKK